MYDKVVNISRGKLDIGVADGRSNTVETMHACQKCGSTLMLLIHSLTYVNGHASLAATTSHLAYRLCLL